MCTSHISIFYSKYPRSFIEEMQFWYIFFDIVLGVCTYIQKNTSREFLWYYIHTNTDREETSSIKNEET